VNAHESEDAAPCAASVPASPRKPSALRRSLAAFRSVSLSKQLTIALLPLAMVGVWAMRDGSASASTAPVAAVHAKPRSTVVNTAYAQAAVSASARARAPTPPPAWLPARALAPDPVAVQTQGRPSDPTERAALVAAFSGNRAEAAALYERLATTRSSRTFALAARLSRDDHIRKP
jgi:hypothetical protein